MPVPVNVRRFPVQPRPLRGAWLPRQKSRNRTTKLAVIPAKLRNFQQRGRQ